MVNAESFQTNTIRESGTGFVHLTGHISVSLEINDYLFHKLELIAFKKHILDDKATMDRPILFQMNLENVHKNSHKFL